MRPINTIATLPIFTILPRYSLGVPTAIQTVSAELNEDLYQALNLARKLVLEIDSALTWIFTSDPHSEFILLKAAITFGGELNFILNGIVYSSILSLSAFDSNLHLPAGGL